VKQKLTTSSDRFSVQATCKHLGIGAHTLRAWEVRHQAVVPERSPAGQRLYSSANLERLESILRLVNLGHSVGVVARLSDRQLDDLLQKSKHSNQPLRSDAQVMLNFLQEFEKSLRSFDLTEIAQILDQKRLSLGTRLFVLEILAPLVAWIGEQIIQGKLSVAHEHAVSGILRDQLNQSLCYRKAASRSKRSPHFVLATPEDDLHEFGILMSTALLSHHGLNSHLLGANLPAEGLALATRAVKGDIIVLGNAAVPDHERRVSFEAFLRQLDQLIPKRIAIWIGGGGSVPHLRSALPGRDHRFISSLSELDETLARLAARNHQSGGSK
jgi:DNA-binding transcriptional MerR regulator